METNLAQSSPEENRRSKRLIILATLVIILILVGTYFALSRTGVIPNITTLINSENDIDEFADTKKERFKKTQVTELTGPIDYSYSLLLDEETNFDLSQGFGVRRGANLELVLVNDRSETYTSSSEDISDFNDITLAPNSSTTVGFLVPHNPKEELSATLQSESSSLEIKLFLGPVE